MSPDGETEVVPLKPKRAPRKRVPKVVSDDAGTPAPVRRASRKQASKREAAVSETPARSLGRKAPTPIADEREKTQKSRKQAIIVLSMIVVGIISSAIVGYTDKGQIDVAGTIAWRNEEARSAGNEGAIIPVQNTSQLPDGGLITAPDGQQLEPSPPSVPQQLASSTPLSATTTEQTNASTTDAVSEDASLQ